MTAGLATPIVNRGNAPDDPTADTLYDTFGKLEDAFKAVFTALDRKADGTELAAEVSRARAAEQDGTEAAGAIDAEAARAQAAERDLARGIDAESARAQAAGKALASGIDAEAARAQAAERDLAGGLAGGIATLSGGNLVFRPFRSLLVLVDGVLRTIPLPGVALSPNGLPIGVRHYAYLYWTGTALAIEPSTTGYVIIPGTSIAVKSDDATRTLIAQFQIVAGPAFRNSGNTCLVRTWYNDPCLNIYSVAAEQFNGSPKNTWGINGTGTPAHFLLWAGEVVDAEFSSAVLGSANALTNFATTFTLDGVAVTDRGAQPTTSWNTAYQSQALSASFSGLAEGYHEMNVAGQCLANNGAVLYYVATQGIAYPTLIIRSRRP